MSSPVVADGKVFIYLNQKSPKGGDSKIKPITTELLIDMGWLPDLPDELAKKTVATCAGEKTGFG